MAGTNQKWYNPYPFPIRLLNDQGDVYVLAPQDYTKVMNGKYTQSCLELMPMKGGERVYKPGLGLEKQELMKQTKQELVGLAWAVCIDGIDEKAKKTHIATQILERTGG